MHAGIEVTGGVLEDAISRMAELETARQSLEAERRQLAEARDASRDAARSSLTTFSLPSSTS